MQTSKFEFPLLANTGSGTTFAGIWNKLMKRLDTILGDIQSGKTIVEPELQNVTVPDNLSLVASALPTWSNKSLRNGVWTVSNTGSTALSVSAGTVIGTGLDLIPNATYSVCFMGENLEENTVKVNDTGKSITLTADTAFPAGDTVYCLILEETV